MSAPEISRVEPGDEAAWTAFVESRPGATAYHAFAWRRVVESLGHAPRCLLARRDGTVTGVLPLALAARFRGNALVSSPAAGYASILAADTETRDALAARALEMARDEHASHVELRSLDDAAPAGYARISPAVRVVLDIATAKPDKETRRHLRIAAKAPIRVRTTTDAREIHVPYAAACDRLGSPAFGPAFFAAILSAFGASAKAFVAIADGVPCASEIWIRAGANDSSAYGGATAAGRAHRAGYALLQARLDCAAADGVRSLDLGRSFRESPSLGFKIAWGGRIEPVHVLTSGERVSIANPESALFRLARTGWRFLPSPIRRSLGPVLVRRLH